MNRIPIDHEQTGTLSDSASHSDSAVDTEELLDRVGGDRDFLKHLIGIFLQDSPESLREISSSVNSGNLDALHNSAHRLKGALGNFAAHTAFQYAQEIERIAMSGNMSNADKWLAKLETEVARVRDALESLATSSE